MKTQTALLCSIYIDSNVANPGLLTAVFTLFVMVVNDDIPVQEEVTNVCLLLELQLNSVVML